MPSPESPPFVTFLSDFGTSDDFAGICHGVINTICPEARVIHITHGIQPQAIGQGARVLAGAIRYVPKGVHLAVVDPGVGSERRAIALRARDGRHFVGPDNGLLLPAAEACGGVDEAVAITNPAVMRQPVSRTFHGRDVFSPAAARLAAGMPLRELGPAIEPADLVRRATPDHRIEGTMLHATVQYVDRFGNIQLAVSADELDGLFQVGRMAEIDTGDDRYYARCADTFADVGAGEFVLYEDSVGLLSFALNRGNAAELTATEAGDEIAVDLAPSLSQEST
jgi:S-adenosyl-L-methionine hydrolase (adenosine-forming)